MALIIVIKMMTRGLFLRTVSTYHDDVDNLNDNDLGDEYKDSASVLFCLLV